MKPISTVPSAAFLIYCIIFLGIFLRLWRLLLDYSLWLDEALLALNILGRYFWELTEPLGYGQAAPILFLWLVKASTIFDAGSELSLRLLPFFSGAGALIVFYFCSKEILTKPGTVIAVALFALSPQLIDRSAEVKQYSTDVFVSVVVTYLGFRLISAPRPYTILIAIFLPPVLIWLSHPTPFLLSAIGVAWISRAALRKERLSLWCAILAIALWIISFVAVYFQSLQEIGGRARFLEGWQEGFMPLGWEAALWLPSKAQELLALPQLGPLIVMLPMAVAGSILLLLRDWRQAIIVLMPIFVTISASAFRLYPFADRLIVFLIPQVILLVSVTADALLTINLRYRIFVLFLALSMLFAHPIRWSAALILVPQNFEKEDFRDVLVDVLDSPECRRSVFIYRSAKMHYRYYHAYRGLDVQGDAKIVGPGGEIQDVLDQAPRCLWIVFSHVTDADRQVIVDALTKANYPTLRTISKIGASAILFVRDG
jgi:uncharacterized membrane protein